MRARGGTALYDATLAAVALRESTAGPSLILVFSDGQDTVSWLDPRDVLVAARRSSAVVYGVTLERSVRATDRADRQGRSQERRWFRDEPHVFARHYLSVLVDETGGSLFVAERADELSALFAAALGDFRSRYLLTYSPRGVDTDGWHEIDVEVDRRGMDVQARPGYLR